MTAPINPSDHLSNPMSAHGGHRAPSPTGTPSGPPEVLRHRRWVIVLAVAAGVHLLCDVVADYLIPGIALLVPGTDSAYLILGLLVLPVVVVLFVSWLATLVAAISVVIRERALARIGAIVILISILAAIVLGIDVYAEGSMSGDGFEAVMRAASLITTILGVLQSIALAVGLVMILIALRRDKAAARR